MITIEGGTFSEVFAALGTNELLDAEEQEAARRVADWFLERDRLADGERSLRNTPGYNPLADDTDVLGDHARKAPFLGDTSPEGVSGREWRTWVCGTIKFVVHPYTTGNSMNVGVVRLDRR